MLRRIAIYIELVKFEHTLFALPFALAGAYTGRLLRSITRP